jgi:hypothetical protein
METKMTPENLQKLLTSENLNPELVLLDDKAAGLILDTKPSTLAVWRSTGRYRLPFLKIGNRVKYRLSDLLAFVDSKYASTQNTSVDHNAGGRT